MSLVFTLLQFLLQIQMLLGLLYQEPRPPHLHI